MPLEGMRCQLAHCMVQCNIVLDMGPAGSRWKGRLLVGTPSSQRSMLPTTKVLWPLLVFPDVRQGRRQEFAKGTKEGAGGRKPSPQRGSGQSPGGVWGQSPQKPETHAEYSTEQSHRWSQIAYCSESDNKFPATTGGDMHPFPPLATPLRSGKVPQRSRDGNPLSIKCTFVLAHIAIFNSVLRDTMSNTMLTDIIEVIWHTGGSDPCISSYCGRARPPV